jgi:SAM-dependent methyltransferase
MSEPATSPADAAVPGGRDPKEIVREGYDRLSRAYRPDDFALQGSGYAHWIARLDARLGPGARVLDLGCGNGVPVVRELARRYAVTGLDLSPVQVERARALVPSARFVCADMSEAAFEPGSFEAVTAFFSIINLPVEEQPALFRRIAGWLVPGGVLLAVVGRVARTVTEKDWLGARGVPMFWSHADLATYWGWLEAAGFAVVEHGVEPRHGDPGFAVLIARKRG